MTWDRLGDTEPGMCLYTVSAVSFLDVPLDLYSEYQRNRCPKLYEVSLIDAVRCPVFVVCSLTYMNSQGAPSYVSVIVAMD